jgi:ech hydrogenase subunit F
MAFFVMTKTVLKSLFRKPVTVKYPFGPATHKEKTRGHIEIDIKACIFCGMCQRKCPTGALAVRREQKEWEIDRMRCISCNACVEICPKKCLCMRNTYSPPATQKQKETFRHA